MDGFITKVQTRAHMFPSSLRGYIQSACNKKRTERGVERALLVEAKDMIQTADK